MVLRLSWEWGGSLCRTWIQVLGEGEANGVWACPRCFSPWYCADEPQHLRALPFGAKPACDELLLFIEGQKAHTLILAFNSFQGGQSRGRKGITSCSSTSLGCQGV